MTGPSSTAAGKTENKGWISKGLAAFAATSFILLLLWFIKATKSDPYVTSTLHIQGSPENGEQLFRMNCAGCHGIAAQGLLAPELQNVSSRRTNVEIINQVIKGLTPPMPSFKPEPESMADLLAYLNSLN